MATPKVQADKLNSTDSVLNKQSQLQYPHSSELG